LELLSSDWVSYFTLNIDKQVIRVIHSLGTWDIPNTASSTLETWTVWACLFLLAPLALSSLGTISEFWLSQE